MNQEARIPRVEVETADPAVRPNFDRFVRQRGKVPNLFRIAAHRPAIEATLAEHLEAVTGAGEVDRRLKELLTVRVSQLNACEYCLASHTMLARRLGASDADIDALAAGKYAHFDEGWQAAFRYADAITRDARVDAEAFAALAAHWNHAQIVEITAVIGLFNYFNRFANALEIPPTR